MIEQQDKISATDSLPGENPEIIQLKRLTAGSRRRADQIWLMYALWTAAAVVILLAIAIPVLRKFGTIDQRLREADSTSKQLQKNVVDLQGALLKARSDLQDLEAIDKARLQAEIKELRQSKADDHATQVALGKKADREAMNQLNGVVASKANTSDVDQRLNQLNKDMASKASSTDVEQKITQLNGVIASKANTNDLDQKINQLKQDISSKASASDLEQKVTQLNGAIAAKANTGDIDRKVDQLNQAIAFKANASDVDRRFSGLSEDLRKGLTTKLDRPTAETQKQ